MKFNTRCSIKKNWRILFRVRSKGMREVTIGLNVFADPSKWDQRMQRAKDRSIHQIKNEYFPARKINQEIEKAEKLVATYFSHCELNGIAPDHDTLYNKLENELKPQVIEQHTIEKEIEEIPKLTPFTNIFEKFKAEMSLEKNWGKKTYCLYQHLWNQLLSYKKNVKSEEIDKKFMNQFKAYLIEEDYENMTINRRFRCLKTILRWAREQGYQVNDEALNYRSNLKEPRKDIVFLKYDEVKQLEEYVFPESKKHLERARDFLCFMSYTGLRYSDLKNLKKAAVTDEYISYSFTVKTLKNIKIPLIDSAKRIIAKYIKTTFGDFVFPIPSNQKLNDAIHDAVKEVGLDREIIKTHFSGSNVTTELEPLHKKVTCHTGRKTFICISLKVGMPQHIVMKITGHADYNAMRPYIEASDDTVKEEIGKWGKLTTKSDLSSIFKDMTDEQIKEIIKIATQMKSQEDK